MRKIHLDSIISELMNYKKEILSNQNSTISPVLLRISDTDNPIRWANKDTPKKSDKKTVATSKDHA